MQRIERILGTSATMRPVTNGGRIAIFLTVAMTLVVSGVVHAAASDARAERHSKPEAETRQEAVKNQGANPEAVGKRLEAAGARLKSAVAQGEMTEEEAWAEWYAVKEKIITEAVEAGELIEGEADAYRHEIHKAELSDRLGAAGGRIRAAAARGELTEEEAWAEWHAAKEELISGAVNASEISEDDAAAFRHEVNKAELGDRLEAAGGRIKAAVASGEVTEDEGWAEWYSAKKELITGAVEAGEISEDDAAAFRREINKAELGDRLGAAGERIKAAVASGEMTEDEGWAEWHAAKEELITEAVDAGKISDAEAAAFQREIRKAELGERLGAAGERIKTAAENGEMTEEEAWAEWHATKEELISGAVDAGEISSADAAAFRHEIEKAEAGERLKAAVARGEMTEEEAWARWAEINKEADAADGDEDPEGAGIEDGLSQNPTSIPDGKDVPDDEWARYVRAFIARYQLTERQQRRAPAGVVEFADKDDPQVQERRKSARERVERDRSRLFERLKARLEKLPTRAQRRDAEVELDKKP